MRTTIQATIIWALTLAFLGYCRTADAAEPLQRRAEIIEIEGKAEMKTAGTDLWKPAEVGMEIRPGDLLRTQKRSYADVSVDKLDIRNTVIRIREDSTIKIGFSASEIVINIITGKLVFWCEKIERDKELAKFEIRTRNTIIGIEGSHGVVSYDRQSEKTESWLKVGGGYIVNIPTGEYNRLSPGANYVESRKKKTKIEKDVRPKIFSYDLRGFRRSYAFLKRRQAARLGVAEKYGKDYLSEKYLTFVGVSDGQVGVAPYNLEGPILIEEILLTSGQQITVKGEIFVVIEREKTKERSAPSRRKKEKGKEEEEEEEEKEEEKKEEKEEEEEDVKLQVDETLDESQEAIP